MDAFYASVEIRDNPSLAGKPVIVGGSPESRSVVCAASYEARKYGVRSAMSCAEAKRRCPTGVFIYPRFEAYTAASECVMGLLKEVTSLVEPLSLDEAYLDVTQNLWNEPSATRIAERLRSNIFKQTGLTASAGVSFNKFLAKIASDHNKPNGIFVITPANVEVVLPLLPVERLWGVGKKTAKVLHENRFFKVSDLRKSTPVELERILGSTGEWLWNLAHAQDDREVVADWDPKSCGSETTFDKDLLKTETLFDSLQELSTQVADSLRQNKWQAMTFTLKVKYFDFRQITRSHTLNFATDEASLIYSKLQTLLDQKTEAGKTPIRLLGVSASGLIRESDPLQHYFEFMKTL